MGIIWRAPVDPASSFFRADWMAWLMVKSAGKVMLLNQVVLAIACPHFLVFSLFAGFIIKFFQKRNLVKCVNLWKTTVVQWWSWQMSDNSRPNHDLRLENKFLKSTSDQIPNQIFHFAGLFTKHGKPRLSFIVTAITLDLKFLSWKFERFIYFWHLLSHWPLKYE